MQRKGRPSYDVFKKRLAIAACASGITVAHMAMDHRISANLRHRWRREHLVVTYTGGNKLKPSEFWAVLPTGDSVPKPPVSESGMIKIGTCAVLLRLEGAVDAATLAQVLRHLHP